MRWSCGWTRSWHRCPNCQWWREWACCWWRSSWSQCWAWRGRASRTSSCRWSSWAASAACCRPSSAASSDDTTPGSPGWAWAQRQPWPRGIGPRVLWTARTTSTSRSASWPPRRESATPRHPPASSSSCRAIRLGPWRAFVWAERGAWSRTRQPTRREWAERSDMTRPWWEQTCPTWGQCSTSAAFQ